MVDVFSPSATQVKSTTNKRYIRVPFSNQILHAIICKIRHCFDNICQCSHDKMSSILSFVIFLIMTGFGHSLMIEDCPHPCVQGGHRYCEPIPCPLPPCNNSFTPAGACCPVCPDTPECPHPCTQGNNKFCGPIPCPKPPCDYPVTPTGACCAECKNGTDCPYPCYAGGKKYCYPIPCARPPCNDSFVPDGACCPVCPNTPQCPTPCGINGHHFCHPIPCPPPPPDCKHVVKPPGGCCEICNGEYL